jgi:predicted ATPase/DNA-binding CsgD family transcriptional regulator
VEVATVKRLLADPSNRLVTITGRTGVGKTRLALEVAWALDAARPGSVQIAWLADVRDPELLATEIAVQLDLVLPGLPSAESVARRLGAAPLVLLLDNFEHLLAACGVLTGLLDACDGLQLLVTSQAPLRLRVERVVRLASFPAPDSDFADLADIADEPAVALYCDRASAVNSQFRLDAHNAADVVELCRGLEGLPLAIELAAARAVTVPAGQLLTRLPGSRLDVLRARGFDMPARHQELRAAIGWTYELLPAFEQRLLQRLSVAAGSFDIDDAESLSPNASADVLDALSSLVDLQMVEPTSAATPRFELSPSIRDFGREELIASGEAAAVEEQWINWLASRANTAAAGVDSTGADTWWNWLEDEHDCLRRALETCLDTARADAALGLVAGLAPYWNSREPHPAHTKLIDRVIELAERQETDRAAMARVLLWSGLLGIRVLHPAGQAKFRDRLRRGADIARSLGDESLLLLSLNCQTLASPMTGDAERAAGAAAEGLELATRLGAAGWIARFELHMARTARGARDEQRALHYGLSALAGARRASDSHCFLGAAILLQTLAPRHPQAAEVLPPAQELADLARATRQTVAEAVLLPVLAVQAIPAGDLAYASRCCLRVLDLYGDDPSSYLAGYALFAALEVVAAGDDPALAARIHGRLGTVLPRLYAGVPPDYVTDHHAVVAHAKEVLGAEDFEAASTAGGAASWESIVKEVRTRLRGLAESAPEPAAPDGLRPGDLPLTERQREVIRLLAAGLTNNEIGRRLGVSSKTVMHHTVAIYQRLGLRGRSEAVAWAIRMGLTS